MYNVTGTQFFGGKLETLIVLCRILNLSGCCVCWKSFFP